MAVHSNTYPESRPEFVKTVARQRHYKDPAERNNVSKKPKCQQKETLYQKSLTGKCFFFNYVTF